MTDYTIRELAHAELDEALALVRRVFDEFEAPDYPEEGLREFYDFIEPTAVSERMEAGALRLWGAFAGNGIAGVMALRPPCHISLLFVDPVHHRRGVARRLIDEAVRQCPRDALTVHASPYGHEAYRRMGFADTGPERSENGLIFVPMRRMPDRDAGEQQK